MSLISMASPWVSDASLSETKKKAPSLRKTLRKKDASLPVEGMATTMEDEDPQEPEQRTAKVAELLQTMTSQHAGEGLADFHPIASPEPSSASPQLSPPPPPPPKSFSGKPPSSHFSANPPTLEKMGNYHQVYAPTPYFTDHPLPGNGKAVQYEDRLWDRLGYIIHLLEEQQNERTDHVLEEYLLYVLLGTFVIYVVDSFSRHGRYVR